MRSPTPVSLALTAGFALGLGCGASVFGCENDLSCSEGGVAGICDASGYCAFPDPQCPSGLRYGEHAPAELAAACVRESAESSTGTTSSDDSTATTVADLEGPGVSSEDSSTSLEDGSSSTDGGSDSSASTEDGGVEASSEGSSTGGEAGGPPCEAGFWDDFESETLARNWSLWTLGSYDAPLQSDGRVRMSLPSTDDGWVGIITDIGPMDGRSAGVEWTFDDFDQLGFAWFNVQQGTKYEFAVYEGVLEVRIGVGGDMIGIAAQPFDPFEHRFVRIRATPELMVWETSSDGASWSAIHSVEHTGVGETHTLEFGIGTWMQLRSGAAIDVQQAFRCP